MEIHTCSRVSLTKKVSEDAMVMSRDLNVYGVFDGATPVTPFLNPAGMNGAYLAANVFKQYFENHFQVDRTLSEGIIQANERLRNEMKLNHVDIGRPEECWSTCAAIVKIDQQKISFAQLGDCMILAETQDGHIKVLTKNTVKGISARAKLKREKERQNGLPLPEEAYYGSVKNQLVYNRSMANTPYGYSVANGTDEVRNYIQSGSIDSNHLNSLLLISDGLFHPTLDLKDVFKRIRQIGLEKYASQLEQEELKNKTHSDDKTGILIHFEKDRC